MLIFVKETVAIENIFTLEQQQQQFQIGKTSFLQAKYSEAEPILYLVLQSALQHNDYHTYVDVQVLLNRLYINTSQFDKLQRSIVQLTSYIPKYGDIESHYFYRLQMIICNRFYSIGKPEEELEQLFSDLKETPYVQLLVITGSNLMLECIENNSFEKAKKLYIELQLYIEENHFDNKMMLYIQKIYAFLAYYCTEDYESCEEILVKINADHRFAVVESFAYMYDICTALLKAAKGDLPEAKALMDKALHSLSSLQQIRFELKLWISLLKKYEAKDDVIYYQSLLIEALEQMYTAEVSDIRRRSIEEKTRQFYETQMYIDQLTGVRNRNFYEDLLAKQQKMKNYCVAVLDIDRFKSINDTYGHTVGDEAIQFIATTLMNTMVKHDIDIIRYGGDEFILLIPYAFEFVKETLYNMHHIVLSTPFVSQKVSTDISLSISVGIAYTKDNYVTIHELFEAADEAIYEAKKTRSMIKETHYVKATI